jgi:NCS1 family nucleobase:cation symporter-1
MILVAVTSEYSPVASMVLMGLGGPALFIIWLSTITTAFLDIYSGAVSLLNVFGKLKQWVAILIVGGIGIGLAFLPWLQVTERFLLILGSLFVPMFAIVLVHYFILAKRRFMVEDIYKSKEGAYWYKSGFDIWTIAIWLIGFALYQLIANQLAVIGASLVTFIATGLLYWAVERNLRR